MSWRLTFVSLESLKGASAPGMLLNLDTILFFSSLFRVPTVCSPSVNDVDLLLLFVILLFLQQQHRKAQIVPLSCFPMILEVMSLFVSE